MLVGMSLLKFGLLTRRCSPEFYRRMLWLTLLAGLPVTVLGTSMDFAHGWDFQYGFFIGQQYTYWASLALAMAWIAGIMRVAHAFPNAALTRRIAAIGRTAFSNYIFHSVICTFLFYGYGLSLFGRVSRGLQLALVLGIWCAELILSPLWLSRFQFGPLEWLWRSLTYLRHQPFRRISPGG
jgi:uncharacterized protein